MTRYTVSHLTRYRYGTTVDLSHQCLRLRPRDMFGQKLEAHDLAFDPEPDRRETRRDHFGNTVDLVALERPHGSFGVTAHSTVAITRTAEERPGPSWSALRKNLIGDGFPSAIEAAEFLHPSPLVPRSAAAAAFAAPELPADRPVVEAAFGLMHRIFKTYSYIPGATDIATPFDEIIARRQGVCQDFAHAMIGMLRAYGLAARYVSGYIRTVRAGEDIANRGADASHAWVSVWCGDEIGWVEFDPTNDQIVADSHIVLAYGRDFADVSPLRGVLLGGGMQNLEVAVTVTPLDPPPEVTDGDPNAAP